MSNKLLSQIEAGCDGRMKLENGKIVFELGSHMVAPPPPSAPPLMADDPVVDELRTELRETKQRLAVLEQQVQQLFKFRESVFSPAINDTYGNRVDFINFNTNFIKFIEAGAATYDVMIGNHPTPFWYGNRNVGRVALTMTDIIRLMKTNLRADMMNHIVIQPRQTITPDCGVIIKFVIDWMATSPNNIEITIMNTGATLAIGFVVGLCEQLNHEKLSKLKITQAKISEQTELRNKVDKTLFRKIEIENLVPSM